VAPWRAVWPTLRTTALQCILALPVCSMKFSNMHWISFHSLSFKNEKKWKFLSLAPIFLDYHCFWKVARPRPFFLLIRTTCWWRRAWSIGGRNTDKGKPKCWGQKSVLNLFATNLTCIGLGSNLGFIDERPLTNHLSLQHGPKMKIPWIVCKDTVLTVQ